MTRYINTKTHHGVETIEEYALSEFPNRRAMTAELRRIVSEYRLSGMDVYVSQRADKTWRAQ